MTGGVGRLANLSEVNHWIDATMTFFLCFTWKSIFVQDRQPAPPWSRASHELPALVCKEVLDRPVLLPKAVYHVR